MTDVHTQVFRIYSDVRDALLGLAARQRDRTQEHAPVERQHEAPEAAGGAT